MKSISRREWLQTSVAGVSLLALGVGNTAAVGPRDGSEFAFHHEHILGTSLDLHIIAPDEATAEKAEAVALQEIEQLRQILSIYDPASELSQVNASVGPVPVSEDLREVLHAYEFWQTRTGGVFHAQLGGLVRVWREAANRGELPAAVELAAYSSELQTSAWQLDPVAGTVERTSAQPLDLNALGKAFIIDRVAMAIRRNVPNATGLLIDLGGDLLAWGEAPWTVAIQDPLNRFDNATPLAGLRLRNQAVASSGGYLRFNTIQSEQYSHILNPLTGRSADHIAGATVVAADTITANALATSLCILSPNPGLRLVESLAGVECVIIDRNGQQFRSTGWQPEPLAKVFTRMLAPADPPKNPWPEGFQATVALELPKIEVTKRYRKPYVAVWLEDDQGKPIRTLGVWGNAPKYLKDLSDWWKIGKSNNDLVKAVARATRGPGKYELIWDGKDDQGNAVSKGIYTVRVEVHREHGAHLRQNAKLECLDKPVTVKMDKNAETAETVVEYKKAEKK